VKLLSSCGPAVATCTFQGNNASSGGALYVAAYGSNGTCTDGDPCQCPPAQGPVLTEVSLALIPLHPEQQLARRVAELQWTTYERLPHPCGYAT